MITSNLQPRTKKPISPKVFTAIILFTLGLVLFIIHATAEMVDQSKIKYVEAVFAAADIEKGERISANKLTVKKIDDAFAQSGVLAEPGLAEGKTALVNIVKESQLTAALIAAPHAKAAPVAAWACAYALFAPAGEYGGKVDLQFYQNGRVIKTFVGIKVLRALTLERGTELALEVTPLMAQELFFAQTSNSITLKITPAPQETP